jgi:pimeloyl-ACP methyl ester carboxylesterase
MATQLRNSNSSFSCRPVRLQDDDFYYRDWGGSGPLIHISHSIGFCAGVYTPLAERLNVRFHVIGLDSRGHGRTKAPADPDKFQSWYILYDDLDNFFRELDQPLIAIGHSMGGTISMVCAVRRPELVRALVIIEPGIVPPSWIASLAELQKNGLTGSIPSISKTAKRQKEWPSREALRASVSEKELFRSWRREFLDAYVEHITYEADDGFVRLRCDPDWEARCVATAPMDIWDYVPQLKTPTLVLYGEHSRTFLPEVVDRFRSEVPHAVFQCFGGNGHNVIMEEPEAVTKVILEFLEANGLPEAAAPNDTLTTK